MMSLRMYVCARKQSKEKLCRYLLNIGSHHDKWVVLYFSEGLCFFVDG